MRMLVVAAGLQEALSARVRFDSNEMQVSISFRHDSLYPRHFPIPHFLSLYPAPLPHTPFPVSLPRATSSPLPSALLHLHITHTRTHTHTPAHTRAIAQSVWDQINGLSPSLSLSLFVSVSVCVSVSVTVSYCAECLGSIQWSVCLETRREGGRNTRRGSGLLPTHPGWCAP